MFTSYCLLHAIYSILLILFTPYFLLNIVHSILFTLCCLLHAVQLLIVFHLQAGEPGEASEVGDPGEAGEPGEASEACEGVTVHVMPLSKGRSTPNPPKCSVREGWVHTAKVKKGLFSRANVSVLLLPLCMYRIAGKFRGTKLSRIAQFRRFHEKKFRVFNAHHVN